jgi:2-oxoglutarate ferredoxin oxidoreductase subunit alpha
MSEGLGLSAQAEIPFVVIDCQRAGLHRCSHQNRTGRPLADARRSLRRLPQNHRSPWTSVIASPSSPKSSIGSDRFQVPGIVLCDLLLSEGRLSVEPSVLNFQPHIDRGELITSNGVETHEEYKRYLITDSGISPRAIPGVPGYTHTVSSDEHDENGVLISDEYTNATKRRAMMEKRMRKMTGIEQSVPPPELIGPPDADVTLIGWGSTYGVIEEACELLRDQGISANQLQIRWLVPLRGDVIVDILKRSRHTIIVENNYSGQFARYLRSETSFVPDGNIRKYDGEPFMPHHIVEAVKEQLAGNTNLSVPVHEIMV